MSAPQAFAHSLAQSMRLAASVVAAVIAGESMGKALVRVTSGAECGDALRAATRDLSYRTLREHGINDALLKPLLHKPLASPELRALLLVAINELRAAPQFAHTTVDQAVEAARLAGLNAAAGLTNALLRNFLRNGDELVRNAESNEAVLWRHPHWWVDKLKRAYAGQWQQILAQSNRHPPMCLRVNLRKTTMAAFAGRLDAAGIVATTLSPTALLLERPVPVGQIPGFAQGEASVQDAGAQLAATLLDVRPGMRVLDACAAPGGKTGHILEQADCTLLAVESDAQRATSIAQNLDRLGLAGAAGIKTADCLAPETWWDGQPFDRILLDAPCSASGVVRRHPDIKWLRRAKDVVGFAATQALMLDTLWPLLEPGGKLLYATCSVFAEENALQVEAFLARHADARQLPFAAHAGVPPGGQLLPDDRHDGFFYALLEKPY
jgi:16S rRNA (cytosine967-C5)-methyltransferase